MPFYTGRSKDGSDMIEVSGMFVSPDGKHWSNTPFTNEQAEIDRTNKQINRVHRSVFDHLSENHRTLREEYDLIIQKKSKLSRSAREYVISIFNEKD